MKTCKKCLVERPLSEFHRHPSTKDGRQGACRICKLEYATEYREKNREKIRASDRAWSYRPANKKKKLDYARKRRDNPGVKKRALKNGRKSAAERSILKKAAKIIFFRVWQRGEIHRPDKCSACGAGGRLEGHHEDYAKPLEVIWMCTGCHGKRHREINELIRNGEDWSEKGF